MSSFRNACALCLGIAVVAGLSGCGGGETKNSGPEHPFQGMKLSVGAVGDPAVLTRVRSQQGEWQATRKAELSISETPVEPGSPETVDVIIFAAERLGDLVDRNALAVIPETALKPARRTATEAPAPGPSTAPPSDPFKPDDIVPALRDQVAKYGKDRMGLPIGGSALVLAYRREAFDRDANRNAADKQSLMLGPPKLWSQLDELARFFQGRDWDGDGKADFGIALALGEDREGVGVATYLARAAALGQPRDQFSFLFDADSLEPRITLPPFVKALKDMTALKVCGPPSMEKFDAAAARAAFQKGNVAMLIDRAENVAAWSGGKAIGVARLPGSDRVYDPEREVEETASPPNQPSYLPLGGGWLVGIAKSATGPKRDAALDFAMYLTSPETSALLRSNAAVPMLPFRASLIGAGIADPQAAPGVESRLWSDAVSRTLNADRVLHGLRIPQASGYLGELDKARAQAAAGKPVKEVLQAAAKSWSERSNSLGKERQLWHYRRSLNSLTTDPEPPKR